MLSRNNGYLLNCHSNIAVASAFVDFTVILYLFEFKSKDFPHANVNNKMGKTPKVFKYAKKGELKSLKKSVPGKHVVTEEDPGE
jgi:hypothetical protein